MRFWKFIKDELWNLQEEQTQEDEQQANASQKDNSNQQSKEQPQEDEQQANASQKDNSNQQSKEQPQEDEQQLNNSQKDNSNQQSEEQAQESDQRSSNSQKDNSNQQSEEQVQEDEQQLNNSQKDNSNQQSEEQPQEDEQQLNNSQKDNSNQQGEEQVQEGEQQLNNSQKDNSNQQGEEQVQEDDQQSSNSHSNSSNQQSGEQVQEDEQQSSNSHSNSSDQQSEEHAQESDQQLDSSDSNSSDQQSEEHAQESDQQLDSSDSNSSNQQSEEHAQESDKQSSNSHSDSSDQQGEEHAQEQVEHISEEIINNHKLTNEQKRELLEKLKKSIEEIRKRKAKKLQREHINQEKQEVEESKEEKYELSEQTNNFLNQLGELPSFEDRNRGAEYSIDTESCTEIPESIIRTLITKFLNQRFCKHNTDLNIRSNSLEKTNGFYKWEVKDVITHLQTHQVTKVLTDKYGYEYANGKNENVPLSFYFDMSGSMSSYTNMLSVIAIELLKKGVKVLIGFNERVNIQIESIEKNITVSELADILESAGYWNGWGSSGRAAIKKETRVKFKYIERNIDNYLIEKKAEKCVVFSDFDPRSEVINLSQVADVYWFCFESSYNSNDIKKFNGFIYKIQNIKDLEQGLLKVNEKRFETLCYTDNPKSLQKKVRVKK